ncbi:MAG: bifunctional glutamate N-acetyltransferase/amino-acid acetyltransferase ArgJ [Coriobacteriales bacterium]|nr:bifunctional glutamate N-acetyltransferase/amino-acid acetyltransferase ArgJ [Coriobacteriales bacterium]
MEACQPLVPPHTSEDPASYGFSACPGGICAAAGIAATGISAGFRRNPTREDLALVAADETCVAAGTFTTNRFCAAPVQVSRKRAAAGKARAVILNSGNANAATGEPGMQTALATGELVGKALGCAPEEVLIASTGVIGLPLSMDCFITGVPAAVESLEHSPQAAHRAAKAIMTTDTVTKEASFAGPVPCGAGGGDVTVHVGGMCKGSGMIQPNMATMLAVVTTDAPLTAEAASAALRSAVGVTFNKVTVDSDTSTNDSCFLLATGKAGGEPITLASPAYPVVAQAVRSVCEALARAIAADGEGSTKLVTVDVMGAATEGDAETVARSIANSPLVKTCIAGHDANWGRVAAAAGKCGVPFEQTDVDIDFMGVPVCRKGLTVPMDEEDMLRRFEQPEISIAVNIGMGSASCRIWTCDLTHDYISINADYRS